MITTPFAIPGTSPEAGTFNKTAAQCKTLVKALKRANQFQAAAILGGYLVRPELHEMSTRLQTLLHLIMKLGCGNHTPTAATISHWLAQLDKSDVARMEDPPEDVFIENVYDSLGNYRLFEGIMESSAFYMQIMLNILEDLPNDNWCTKLKKSIHAILKLSEEIAERANLKRNVSIRDITTTDTFNIDSKTFEQLKHFVVFTPEDLQALDIDMADLAPFMCDNEVIKNIDQSELGTSPLEAKPLLQSGENIAVVLPPAISLAARRLVIETFLDSGRQDYFEKLQVEAYSKFIRNPQTSIKLSSMPCHFDKVGSFHIANSVKKVDTGRYLHFMLLVDGLNDYIPSRFLGHNPVEEAKQRASTAISKVSAELRNQEDFKEAITIIVFCGWGQTMIMDESSIARDWNFLAFAAPDLFTLTRHHKFEELDLFRVLDAQKTVKKLGTSIMNANGFPNLYAWMQSIDGHIIKHEELPPDRIKAYVIPTDSILSLRSEVKKSLDTHNVATPSEEYVTVNRYEESPSGVTNDYSPFYCDIRAFSSGLCRVVYEAGKSQFWIEVLNTEHLDMKIHIDLSKMVLHWVERVCHELLKMEKFHNKKLLWECKFFDKATFNYPDPTTLDSLNDIVSYSCDSTTHQINIHVQEGFLAASNQPSNVAETEIVRALVKSAYELLSLPIANSELEKIIQAVIPGESRQFHVFSNPQPRDALNEILPAHGQIISDIDFATIRLDLGWKIRNRLAGSSIEGITECCQYLNQLVNHIGQKIVGLLRDFNRAEIIKILVTNHETLMLESTIWQRTAGTRSSDEVENSSRTFSEVMSKIYLATISSRILIEMALCESPENGGNEIGELETRQLMAMARLMFHYAGDSDAIKVGLIEPDIRISPLGDVLMNFGFVDNTITPFGEKFYSESYLNSGRNYNKNYAQNKIKHTNSQQAGTNNDLVAKFKEAWQDEYGFSTEDMDIFIMYFCETLTKNPVAIKTMKQSVLLASIETETNLSSEKIKLILDNFSLWSRPKWNEAPPSYLKNSWQPWRFRRQLSLISKPIIRLNNNANPTLIITPTMIIEHLKKLRRDVSIAVFDQTYFRNGGMLQKWTGSINDKQGNEFNETVAERFRKLGWNAKSNLSDGEILSLPKCAFFGDVDVLAWQPATRRVLVIECKSLMLDKTTSEIVWRLSNYQGKIKSDGKRDALRRHIDRYEYLENHKDKLRQYVKCDNIQLESILLFANYSPMHFAKHIKDLGVQVVAFQDIEAKFSQ